MLKASLVATALLLAADAANAAQMKLLVGGAMQEPFREVGADFAKRTGHMLDFTVDTTGALQKRVRSGEKADIILVSAPGMDALAKENLIVPGTRIDLASAAMGVSVRAGLRLLISLRPKLSRERCWGRVLSHWSIRKPVEHQASISTDCLSGWALAMM